MVIVRMYSIQTEPNHFNNPVKNQFYSARLGSANRTMSMPNGVGGVTGWECLPNSREALNLYHLVYSDPPSFALAASFASFELRSRMPPCVQHISFTL